MKRRVIIGLILIVLIGGSYAAYEYVKDSPPPFLVSLATRTPDAPPLPPGDTAPLTVPDGFTATIYARDLPNARDITRDSKGTMLVSLTKGGKVVALPDLDGNGKADRTVTVLEGLSQPHGIYVRCPSTGNESADQDGCLLYVAETNALASYAYDADTYTATNRRVLATFPSGRGHYTRTLLPHPDGEQLLVSVGSSCNVCIEKDPTRATVQAFSFATGELRTFATGLRNTVFMALHPVTGEVWGTDNGRDMIGDDIPPDELNIIRPGNNYGWPTCFGKNVLDPDGEGGSTCEGKTPSHIDLPAHAAALGLAFVPEEGWPEEWWHDAIVAYHGSWNRSTPAGYKVVRINLSPEGAPDGPEEDFVTGFLEGNDEDAAIGRPVDVLIEPGGVMYLSDDRAGAIYRIARTSMP